MFLVLIRSTEALLASTNNLWRNQKDIHLGTPFIWSNKIAFNCTQNKCAHTHTFVMVWYYSVLAIISAADLGLCDLSDKKKILLGQVFKKISP